MVQRGVSYCDAEMVQTEQVSTKQVTLSKDTKDNKELAGRCQGIEFQAKQQPGSGPKLRCPGLMEEQPPRGWAQRTDHNRGHVGWALKVVAVTGFSWRQKEPREGFLISQSLMCQTEILRAPEERQQLQGSV